METRRVRERAYGDVNYLPETWFKSNLCKKLSILANGNKGIAVTELAFMLTYLL